jgi:hypothetical protein
LFDASPETFGLGQDAAFGEGDDPDHDDDLRFRSLIERPEALTMAWRTVAPERRKRR